MEKRSSIAIINIMSLSTDSRQNSPDITVVSINITESTEIKTQRNISTLYLYVVSNLILGRYIP